MKRAGLSHVGVTELFDARPIELPGFRLRARSADVVGRPTQEQTANVLKFAVASHDAAPYWLGDVLNHIDTREDWGKDERDSIAEATGYALETLTNMSYVSRKVEEPERQLAPSFAHAQEVAPLPRPEQTKYLKAAREQGMTRRELRQRIKSDLRRAVIDGQAALEGMFRVIYADPPWEYHSSAGAADGAFATAHDHYPVMSIEDLCKLPVAAHAMPDSVLFMWTTAPLLLQNPGPREVLEAWGFKYKTNSTWDKVLGNFGHYFRVTHEHLIVATRGSCLPDEPTPQPDSVQVIRRSDEHSQKPEEYRRIITKLYTRGPYLELFGREPHDGWKVFGNDARLWAMEAHA